MLTSSAVLATWWVAAAGAAGIGEIMAWRNLEPGRLYDITWVDIVESPADPPKDGKIATFVNSYRFFARRYQRVGAKRVPYLVFTSGQGADLYHYCAFPEGCIVDIQPAR